MSARSKFVSVKDLEASIHDSDPSLDLGFMAPHFTPDWEQEISDYELDAILSDNEKRTVRNPKDWTIKDGLRVRS